MPESKASQDQSLVLLNSAKEALLVIFPFAIFSPLVSTGLDRTKEEKFIRSHNCYRQLVAIRHLYHLLQSQISGTNLLFPLFLENIETKDKDHESFKITWVGDHDPLGLHDSILVHATTKWEWHMVNRSFCSIKLEWSENIWGLSKEEREKIRIIMRTITPEFFNQIFKDLFKSLMIISPCPKGEIAHPDKCDFCENRGEFYRHEKWGSRFRPSAWFEMVTGFYGWDNPKDRVR